jgi:hypothetical protein
MKKDLILNHYQRYTESEKAMLMFEHSSLKNLKNLLKRTEKAVCQARYYYRKKDNLPRSERKPFTASEISLILDKVFPDESLAKRLSTTKQVIQVTRSRINSKLRKGE